MREFEYESADQRFYDFCLWEYPPLVPHQGKMRSANVLFNSFEVERTGGQAADIMRAIRLGLGDSRSVWGVKQEGGKISWELYFYDYERLARQRSIPKVMEIIRPWIPCDISISEKYPYFMFSIDLDGEMLGQGGPLEEIQMYIGNIGSIVSSGICYAVTRDEKRLKNFYFFFDARTEMQNIIGKISASAYLEDPVIDMDAILWPELRDCRTIVVANKQSRDGVYFSRINVRQLLKFLRKLHYPAGHIDMVEQHQNMLDHLLFDVGFDYCMQGSELNIVKSAYYGVF